MKNKQQKHWKPYLRVYLMGFMAGGIATLAAGLQAWTPLRLPHWTYSVLFWAGIIAIVVYGSYVVRRQPLLSRTWAIVAVLAAMFFNGIGFVSADYLGPNRTVETTSWERQFCQYRAFTAPNYYCVLSLYYPPNSCPPTSSVGSFFNNAPSACGTSWPGTCGSTVSCTIIFLNNTTVSCNSGDPGCTKITSSTTLPPATVSGATACSLPGNAGWCRGTATLNLSGNEPLAGYSLTIFEGNTGTLCSAPSCAWTFPEGITNLSYWVHSTYGDTSAMSSASMMVDGGAPALTLNIPPPNGLNGWHVSAVTASAAATDALSGISGSASINGGGASFTASTDGIYNLTAIVSDVAGNTTSTSGTIKLDVTPPSAGFNLPAPNGQNGWYVSAVTVTPNGSDATSGIASQEVSLDNAAWLPSVTIATDGTRTIYGRISDVAGNTTASTTTLRVDTTPPSVTVTIPPPSGGAGWYTSQTLFSTSGADAVSGVASTIYSVDGGAWVSNAPTISDGTHTVQVRVTDLAGNITTSTTTVRVDATPPSSAFGSPPEGSTTVVNGRITMSGATADATSGATGAEISLNGGANWLPLALNTGGSWSYNWDTTQVNNGTYAILVRARDIAGNQENTARVTIVVSNEPPPLIITTLLNVFDNTAVPPPPVEQVAVADTGTEPTSMSTTSPLTTLSNVVVPPTPIEQVAVVDTEAIKKIETPTIQKILWPAFAFIGLLAVLASASLSDRRPRELRALAKSLDTTREIQNTYWSEEE